MAEGWSIKAGSITWSVVDKSTPEEQGNEAMIVGQPEPTSKEYHKVGLHSFDFGQSQVLSDKIKGKGMLHIPDPKAVEEYPLLGSFHKTLAG